MSAPIGRLCPKCGALPGQPCDLEDPSWAHGDRWQAALRPETAPAPQPWEDAYAAWRIDNPATTWPLDAFRAGYEAATKDPRP